MVRDFDPRPVPLAVIETCIAAVGTAPSGGNHQPWRFVIVGDPATKRSMRVAAEEEEQFLRRPVRSGVAFRPQAARYRREQAVS
ncbi:nitroreductase family protein [Rhizobium leguminosarum]|uniref:nitroreductase family protein n=1 Tax=Rhizobium leguminosarum TaxID=384 RepID=UPI003F97DAD8